jgi:hypothetical protein
MSTQTAAARTRAAQKRTAAPRRGRAAAAEAGAAPARRRATATAEKRTTGRGRATATAEKRTTARRRAQQEAAATRAAERRRERERERQAVEEVLGAKGIDLPLVGHVGLPSLPMPVPKAKSLPGQVLWLGGLAGVALLGVIEWPVAAAVAAGTWIAERWARSAIREVGSARERRA